MVLDKFDKISAVFLLTTALLFFAPFLFGKFIVFVIAYILINMLLATGTWAIFHQAGQALFALVVIAGVSGYVTAILGQIISNTWITIFFALVVSCGMGMLFYLIGSRILGHIQFAVLNLAFIFVFNYFIIASADITKGPDGLKVDYFTPQSFFSDMNHRYWVVLLITALCLIIINRIMTSNFGKTLTLIGRNPLLAATVGIDVKKYTIYSYLIFSPAIGLGGALYVHFVGYQSPAPWNADYAVIIVFCSLIGGTINILGPIVGAILATGIPILFDVTAEFRFGIVGILGIVIFLLKPEGIVGWLKELVSDRRDKLKEEKG